MGCRLSPIALDWKGHQSCTLWQQAEQGSALTWSAYSLHCPDSCGEHDGASTLRVPCLNSLVQARSLYEEGLSWIWGTHKNLVDQRTLTFLELGDLLLLCFGTTWAVTNICTGTTYA